MNEDHFILDLQTFEKQRSTYTPSEWFQILKMLFLCVKTEPVNTYQISINKQFKRNFKKLF